MTLDRRAQQRLWVLNHVLAGELTAKEAAAYLHLSVRSLRRLLARYHPEEGAAALVHGNRGRVPANRLDEALRGPTRRSRQDHVCGRQPGPPRRPARGARGHRRGRADAASGPRRGRSARGAAATAAGSSAPSRADGEGGHAPPGRRQPPRLARGARSLAHARGRYRRCHGARDGGHVPRAGGHGGLPRGAHPDSPWLRPAARALQRSPRHLLEGAGQACPRSRSSSPAGARRRSWAGPSKPPPSPGWRPAARRPRVASSGSGGPRRTASSSSCAWRARTLEEANSVLAAWLPRHNARFAVPAADPEPVWRPVPGGLAPEELFCFRHDRVVARDGTFALAGVSLMLAGRVEPHRLGRRLVVSERLDGSRWVEVEGTFHPVVAAPERPATRLRTERRATRRGHRMSWPPRVVLHPTIPGDATLPPGTGDKVAGRLCGQGRWPSTRQIAGL